MQFRTVGDDDGDDLPFLLGWGNSPDHEHVSWLLDQLAAAGYRVHAVEIPTNVTDFERDYLRPVERYLGGFDYDALLSHSTGGLIAAHLDGDARRVYLSPWWGLNVGGAASVALPILLRIPTARQFIRTPPDAEAIGELKTESEAADGPRGLSPAFLRTIRDAQASLPDFRSDGVVFCTLSDRVVSVRAIGERAPASRVRLYDGGHEFFASASRDAVLPDVIAALEAGRSAIRA